VCVCVCVCVRVHPCVCAQAASAPEAWRTEKWYGTLHRVAPLEAKLLTSW
jgi:hypothetical protein